MNAKEISKFEVPNLTKNLTQEFHARGRPRSGNDANLSLEELCYIEKKMHSHLLLQLKYFNYAN